MQTSAPIVILPINTPRGTLQELSFWVLARFKTVHVKQLLEIICFSSAAELYKEETDTPRTAHAAEAFVCKGPNLSNRV